MLASVTMCNDDIRNYNSKISDLGPLTILIVNIALAPFFSYMMLNIRSGSLEIANGTIR